MDEPVSEIPNPVTPYLETMEAIFRDYLECAAKTFLRETEACLSRFLRATEGK